MFYQLDGKVFVAGCWFDVTVEVSDGEAVRRGEAQEATIAQIWTLGPDLEVGVPKAFPISIAAGLFVQSADRFISLYEYLLNAVCPKVLA